MVSNTIIQSFKKGNCDPVEDPGCKQAVFSWLRSNSKSPVALLMTHSAITLTHLHFSSSFS